MTRRNKGFSLIELIVVLAIVAILGGVVVYGLCIKLCYGVVYCGMIEPAVYRTDYVADAKVIADTLPEGNPDERDGFGDQKWNDEKALMGALGLSLDTALDEVSSKRLKKFVVANKFADDG